jgi:predicted DNA-binding protein
MPATRDKTENLKVRMPPQLYERVQNAAGRSGHTVSGYVRNVLQKQLAIEERIYENE